MARLLLADVWFRYASSREPALRGLSLRLDPGEVLLVTGPSGGGKTTLARLAAGLIPGLYGGELRGRVERRYETLAYIGPGPEEQILLPTVGEELASRTARCRRPTPISPGEALRLVGLRVGLGEPVFSLSAGAKQRLALASLALCSYDLVVVDEALDAVGLDGALAALRLLADQAEAGAAVLLVEKDPALIGPASRAASRVVLLEGGRIVASTDRGLEGLPATSFVEGLRSLARLAEG